VIPTAGSDVGPAPRELKACKTILYLVYGFKLFTTVLVWGADDSSAPPPTVVKLYGILAPFGLKLQINFD